MLNKTEVELTPTGGFPEEGSKARGAKTRPRYYSPRFPDKLKRLRDAKNFTLDILARGTGRSQPLISSWSNLPPDGIPNMYDLHHLAQMLAPHGLVAETMLYLVDEDHEADDVPKPYDEMHPKMVVIREFCDQYGVDEVVKILFAGLSRQVAGQRPGPLVPSPFGPR